MRIAFVHSFYRSDQPSGENQIVLDQAAALQRAGHVVHIVARRTDDHSHWWSPLASAVTVSTGLGPSPIRELRAFGPDVVHVHNLFPNFGERWVGQWDGPLVATLHNFRYLCANSALFRDGHNCTQCADGDALAGLRHKCYRDSVVATAPLAVKTRAGMKAPLLARADRVVALSPRSADTFVGYGLDAAKVRVIPHGVDPIGIRMPAPSRPRWIAMGRLDAAKGFAELVHDWPVAVQLDIAGDGPQRGRLGGDADPQVTLMGRRSREWLTTHLGAYTGLVFPSPARQTAP